MNKKIKLADDDLIVSKTDELGTITYCNRTFMRISGYSSLELLAQPHSIIRHPDTPRGIFKLLWNTIQRGQEHNGFVKNRARNGDSYWCYYTVTPNFDANDRLKGYFSVQWQARPEALDSVKDLYRQMTAIEKRNSSAKAPEASLQWLKKHLADQETEYEPFIIHLQNGEQ